MEKIIKNFLICLGTVLVAAGSILFYLEAISWMFLIFFIIAGIIVIIISLYNWNAGTDFSARQETPMENEGIEYKRF